MNDQMKWIKPAEREAIHSASQIQHEKVEAELTKLAAELDKKEDAEKEAKAIEAKVELDWILAEKKPAGDLLQNYIGCKIIKARPMDKYTFDEIKGRNRDNSENSQGYWVEYEDGYTSWYPKHTFENAYRLISEGESKLLGL